MRIHENGADSVTQTEPVTVVMEKTWRQEIIECGELVQDGNESVTPKEAERR